MNTIYLEHANITVTNLERGINFFKIAFPSFTIRGEGKSNGKKWVHLGNDNTYLALYEKIAAQPVAKDMNAAGINHIGFVVENVQEIANRLTKAGYKRDYPKQIEEFRIRDYFVDDDGNEFEFVQYLSDKPEEKNKYT